MLISSRTPLRISFVGGGTDYPEYFEREPGAVVGLAINRYIYISVIKLADFINYRYRLSYSKLEIASDIQEIEHPVVRNVLDHYNVREPLDINVMAELPSCTGLGSSSSFTVGLINLVSALKETPLTRLDLAHAAIHTERVLLKERVGVQDQLHAAFGGMNRFDFKEGRTQITPIHMRTECQSTLMSSLVLVYTGIRRFASNILDDQLAATSNKELDQDLSHLMSLTDQTVNILESPNAEGLLDDLGSILHEGWMTKKKLGSKVSTPHIDALYDYALASGAIGGKLCGAGGGGFMLFLIPPQNRKRFDEAMAGKAIIPIELDTNGSTIVTNILPSGM